MKQPIGFTWDDGGRAAAGYKGEVGDCVVRAIAIATGMPYKQVYKDLYRLSGKSPRLGVDKKIYRPYLESHGWKWVPVMEIGGGCRVHLRADELPQRRLIVSLSKHLAAVINGTLHDTSDCSRGGTRCVYGYFMDTQESAHGYKDGDLLVVEEYGHRELYRVVCHNGRWCARAFRDRKLHDIGVLERLYGVKSIKKESIDEQF